MFWLKGIEASVKPQPDIAEDLGPLRPEIVSGWHQGIGGIIDGGGQDTALRTGEQVQGPLNASSAHAVE